MTPCEQIFYNGTILTMDSGASKAEALAIGQGKILAVGSEKAVMAYKEASTKMVDLQGKTMLPGFIDGHSHITMSGEKFATQLDLTSPPVGGVTNIEDILAIIKEKVANTPKGEWIVGFGYDDTLLAEKRHPEATDIDRVAPDNPVYLSHVSGHLCTCNTLALQLGNVHTYQGNPAGGMIRRNEDGSPNGVLEEPAAMNMVYDCVPPLTEEDWMRALGVASAKYAAKGVTTAQDGWATENGIDMLRKAHAMKDSPLKVRVHIFPGLAIMDINTVGCTTSGTQLTDDNMLSLGATKHFVDGSLQCYTGFLSNPYHKVIYDLPDGPLWRGYPIEPAHELTQKVIDLHCKGWQIAIHGNGDDAIESIINAYEAAQKVYPRADARHIIVHCQTVREDQLDRMKRLGIIPSFFVVHTYYWGDRHYETFLGPERAERINPLYSAVKRGIPFSTHNDTFVTPMDPLLSVWSAVNRTTSGGRTLGENQRISVLDALRSITSWAAYQCFEEKLKGSLEVGKLADMVILEENPLEVAVETIKDIKVATTLVGGKVIYGELPS